MGKLLWGGQIDNPQDDKKKPTGTNGKKIEKLIININELI